MEPDLFTAAAEERQQQEPGGSPLAVRMRPRTLDEVVGQRHLLGAGSPLRRLVGEGAGGPAGPASVILWGPPGTGKTTLAYVVSRATKRRFVELSAITAGVKEVRAVIDSAKRESGMYGRETLLFLDEIHRFSKAQQDSLLPAVENRWVTLIAATTENPYFSIISPLLSRSLLLTLEALAETRGLVHRALTVGGVWTARWSWRGERGAPAAHRRRRRPAGADRPGKDSTAFGPAQSGRGSRPAPGISFPHRVAASRAGVRSC